MLLASTNMTDGDGGRPFPERGPGLNSLALRNRPLEEVYRYSLRAIWALVRRVAGRGGGPSDEGLGTEQRQQDAAECPPPPPPSSFPATGGSRDYTGPEDELEVLFGDESDDEAWIVLQWASWRGQELHVRETPWLR